MVERLEPALDAARAAVGAFVGAGPDDLAFVTNATTGVNTVLRSLRFEPGDELLTTDHEYNAVRNALDYVAARDGARVVVAEVPFPLGSPEAVVSAVMGAVTARTRLAVLDHVTSATALVLPVADAGCRVGGARRRHADRRRARARHGGAGCRRPGRRVLHRQPAQVGVRAEGRGLPLGPPRPPGADPPARDLARRQLAARRSVALPARVRLAGDRRPVGLAGRAGRHRLRRVAASGRLAGTARAEPRARAGGPRHAGRRPSVRRPRRPTR